ncbi:MAG: xanthine dehydrogenase accessory protein XdhC [Rhodospirillaceae bacterium]|nr:xanthine dehydrogenase accessory protein XdhC [Rhodospirillaceae bacterium]MCY4065744.1 xanthine dehydrogenase accessory protein XdhC [Rhodospirillaceae bacterium]
MTAAWLDTVRERASTAGDLVSVIVAAADGSAPREPGAWMLVEATGQTGTVGGGRLEWEATRTARDMLAAPAGPWLRDLRDYPLGPDLEQCCGGFVRLLYERIGAAELAQIPGPASDGGLVLHPVASGPPVEIVTGRQAAKALPFAAAKPAVEILSGQAPRATVLTPPEAERWLLRPVDPPGTPLYLYGAGHVGRAIVRALDGLPFAVTWIDTDEARFPPDIPGGVRRLATRDPAGIAAAAPDGAFHLVLTYSHATDYDICHALLAGNRFGFAGLIGSETKRARFFKRFRDAGLGEAALARLACPIGLPGIPGKEPATIAVTVAAQLLHRLATAEAVSGADERHA